MIEPTTEDILSFFNRLLEEWKSASREAPDAMRHQGVACIESVIALLVTVEEMEREKFAFGMGLIARQGWLIGMVQAKTAMMLRHMMREEATIGDARKMTRKLHDLVKTRGQNE